MTLPLRFEDLPEEDQSRLRSAMAQLSSLAGSYSNFLVIGEATGDTPVWNIASCFAVRLREREFVITAAHVYRHYQRRRLAQPSVHAQAGRLMIPLHERERYVSDDLDIAVFDLAELNTRLLGRDFYVTNRLAPVVAPVESDYVQFSGFPAYYRQDVATRESSLAALNGFVEVTGAEHGRIYCHVDRDYMLEFGPEALPPASTVLGGLSGGPVLMRGTLHYPVVGLISEFLASLDVFKCAIFTEEVDAALGAA